MGKMQPVPQSEQDFFYECINHYFLRSSHPPNILPLTDEMAFRDYHKLQRMVSKSKKPIPSDVDFVFACSWNNWFGVQKSTLVARSGWYLFWFSVVKRYFSYHPDRLSQRLKARIAQWEISNSPENDPIVAVRCRPPDLRNIEELVFVPEIKKLTLSYGQHDQYISRGDFWALTEVGFDREKDLFFIELPDAGTVPFQRAATLCQVQNDCDFSTPEKFIVYLFWLFAAGKDNALEAARGFLHKNSSYNVSEVRRIVKACISDIEPWKGSRVKGDRIVRPSSSLD